MEREGSRERERKQKSGRFGDIAAPNQFLSLDQVDLLVSARLVGRKKRARHGPHQGSILAVEGHGRGHE